jgi:hypothetical protein
MNDVVVTISKWAMLSVWQGIVEMVRMLDCCYGWAVLFVIAWLEITHSSLLEVKRDSWMLPSEQKSASSSPSSGLRVRPP